MEWAGGANWEGWVDSLAEDGEKQAINVLGNQKKMYPKDWEWKGEHWDLARSVSQSRLGSQA